MYLYIIFPKIVMNKKIIPYLFVAITISIVILFSIEHYHQTVKIKFLENELATKSLHYEWLSEIMDSVLENGKIPVIDTTKIMDKT